MQNIICFGDSITHCLGQAEASRWTARVAFSLEERFPGSYDVYNKGVGGNTTALALDRIQVDVVPLLPGIVLLEFGINDAYVYPWCRIPRVGLNDFEKNLNEIVHLVTANGGKPCLIVNHPVTAKRNLHRQGNKKSLAANLETYNLTIRRIATSHRTPCLDLPRLLKKKNVLHSGFCSEDEVHLSSAGNRIYADCVFDFIQTLIGTT